MDAHGGWVASAEDLLKFVCSFDRFNTRPDILSAATIDTLINPSFNDPNYAFGIAVNAYNNWWHMGSLPGTTSEIVRNGNHELNWAILLNTRDQNASINRAVDHLVWSVLPTLSDTDWPDHDLFTKDYPTGSDGDYRTTNALDINPNPTKGKINFSIHANVQILNAQGQIVASLKNVNTVDITNQPSGIYFLTFTDINGQVVQRNKIVKE